MRKGCVCKDSGAQFLEQIAEFNASTACGLPGECYFAEVGSYSESQGLEANLSNFMFSDGSWVVPLSTSRIQVGVLVPDPGNNTGAEAKGLEARPAVSSAASYVGNSQLLERFNFTPEVYNTECQQGTAMLSYMTAQEAHPIAMVGDGCDATTVSLASVASTRKQVLIGWGASTTQLDDHSFYLSTSDSLRHYISGFLQVCEDLGIYYIGLVQDAYQFNLSLEFSTEVTARGSMHLRAVVTVASGSPGLIGELDQIRLSAARAVMLVTAAETATEVVSALPSSSSYAGHLWFTTSTLFEGAESNQTLRPNIVGWLTAGPHLDTSDTVYQEFLSGYQSAKNSTPATFYSAAVFNGLFALASAVHELFERSIYQTDPTFGSQLYDYLLRLNLPGAGTQIHFESSGQLALTYNLYNYDTDSQRIHIARWSSSNVEALSLGSRRTGSGLVLPGSSAGSIVSSVPNPAPVICSPGSFQFSSFVCQECPIGTYTADYGQTQCLKCDFGTYAAHTGMSACTECPSGSSTWQKGADSPVMCMCTEGYHDTTVLWPSFESLGCFVGCKELKTDGDALCTANSTRLLNTYMGTESEMSLQLCNNLCGNQTYFGVQQGSECWCGDSYNLGTIRQQLGHTNGPNVSVTCDDGCTGSPLQTCGGQETISVYLVADMKKMKNNQSSTCTKCPEVASALADEKAATCLGGWYQPFARKRYWAKPGSRKYYKCFQGQCDGGNSEGGFFGNYTVTSVCGDGAYDNQCSACKENYFKRGKACMECPALPFSIFGYILGPIVVLGYFPLMRSIIVKWVPAMFIINTYLQVCNQFGGFAIAWPRRVKEVLDILGIANFDLNLMLLGCTLRPGFAANWVLHQIIPLFYAACYFGRHYLYKYLDRGEKRMETTLLGAWHCTLFCLNLLYLTLTSKSLVLYSCAPVGDGGQDYYLVADPSISCYEGEHIALVIASIVPLICYTIGWPLVLMIAFSNAKQRHLFHDPDFKSMFGFIYTRFEMEWYFWHFSIIFHKFSIVVIKIFLFDRFSQAPCALLLTFLMMAGQTYARPYQSDSLDRLQTFVYGCQFLYLFIGVLLSTERGSTDQMQQLEVVFFLIFGIAAVVCVMYMRKNLLKFYGTVKIARYSKQHSLGLQHGEWTFEKLLHWVGTRPSPEELELMKHFHLNRDKYPCPAHLIVPYIELAKEAPELLDYCCQPDYSDVSGTLGVCLQHFFRKSHDQAGIEASKIEDSLGPGLAANSEAKAPTVLSLCTDAASLAVRDVARKCLCRNKHSDNSEEGESVTECPIRDLIKEASWGKVLYFLINCTVEERRDAVELFRQMWASQTKAVTSMDEVAETSEDVASVELLTNPLHDGPPCDTLKEDAPPCDILKEDALQMLEIPRERREKYRAVFTMYDLDDSGFIDSEQELRGYIINAWWHLKISRPASAADELVKPILDSVRNGARLSEGELAMFFEQTLWVQFGERDLESEIYLDL